MTKRVYVVRSEDLEPSGIAMPVRIFFSFHIEEACPWPTKEQAQNGCQALDSLGVVVTGWVEGGGEFVCKNFGVDQRESGQCVVFCEGPFTYRTAA